MIQEISNSFEQDDELPVKRSIQVWRSATPLAEIWIVIACGDMLIETLNEGAPYSDERLAIERGHYESQRYGFPFNGKILNCE